MTEPYPRRKSKVTWLGGALALAECRPELGALKAAEESATLRTASAMDRILAIRGREAAVIDVERRKQ